MPVPGPVLPGPVSPDGPSHIETGGRESIRSSRVAGPGPRQTYRRGRVRQCRRKRPDLTLSPGASSDPGLPPRNVRACHRTDRDHPVSLSRRGAKQCVKRGVKPCVLSNVSSNLGWFENPSRTEIPPDLFVPIMRPAPGLQAQGTLGTTQYWLRISAKRRSGSSGERPAPKNRWMGAVPPRRVRSPRAKIGLDPGRRAAAAAPSTFPPP